MANPEQPVSVDEGRAHIEFDHVELPLSGCRAPRSRRHLVLHRPRPDAGHRGQHRRRQDFHSPSADTPPLRRDRRLGAHRRSRRAKCRSRRPVVAHRAGSAEAVPVLRHSGQQPGLRQAGGYRGRDVGGPRGGPGRRLRVRRMPGQLEARIDQGGINGILVVSASVWPSPGPWFANPISTCSTTPSRPWTWRPTPACGRRWRRTPRTARCST